MTPTALARLSPPAVANPSDNLKNLFEIPVLFYVLVLYLFAVKQVDALYVDAAWIFVTFRVLHSAVHCTFNLIMLRFYLYLIATVAVWFIAFRAGDNLLRRMKDKRKAAQANTRAADVYKSEIRSGAER